MLFVGKVTLDDIPVLYQHYLEGLIAAPRYLPPMLPWIGTAPMARSSRRL